ncbi:MAG TPA: response regulator [Terriglobia bacterium]|nr:response regulator [Terriglobia bacterium]
MAIPIKPAPKRFGAAYERPPLRILLVDEDPSNIRYYYGILRALGHDVVVSASYAEALSLLEKENFDMAVVAQGSPAFEGRAVVAKALETNPDLPVLVVARTLDIDCYMEAMEMGAVDYLERCAAPLDFMRSVDAHLEMKAAA